MGRCSYTWKEWDSEKGEYVEKQCQKETWEGSDEFCIFHDPSPDKDVDLFRKKLEEQMESETKKYNFIGYYFPGSWDFSSQEFEIDANFSGAIFQNADFRGATFQDANFEKATFQDANFREATFQDANFWEATFRGTADFWEATFRGTADFWEATFQGTASFSGVFQDADFGGATFQGTAYFWEATFQDAYFGGATFQGTAYFWEATFQDADFREATFRGTAYFRGATFQDADFGGATFQGAADFRGATFQGTVYFGGATFQDAYFREATFQGTVYFGGATFQDAYFGGATFQDAYFREATFQDADFRGATFQDANFREATFQDADFREATFRGTADFRGATFHKKVELAPENNEKMNFKYTEFLFKSYITADLSKTLFHRASIENVAFVDCEWPDDYIIFEEKHMNDEDINLTFNQLETIYRDLKQNMQNHGDYDTAGKFYYREMEMKRNQYKLFRKKWWIQNILRILCGYGEKPLWVIRNAIIIVILGAISYFFSGIARVGAEIPVGNSPYIINYSLNSLNLSITLLNDFFYCLYYSVVTFTTLGYGDIHPVGKISHAISFIEAFIGAFFIALFVVVVVRKMAR
ncbi:MAG: pentapeptide repeat-containing protein [Candidatus Methanofastidiosia archaeon]|jgi:uncharacterized protein YjbI with pentapeptide repeats